MTTVELRLATGGASIVSSGCADLLYLIGRDGRFQWVDRIESDALPVLVAAPFDDGVCFAPLHPMCHLGTDTGRIVKVKSGDTIRIGVTEMSVHLKQTSFLKHLRRRVLLMTALVALIFASGWFLRGIVQPASPVTAQFQEDVYVF